MSTRENIRLIARAPWPWRKKGQPRFIICAALVGLTSPMLRTKSQGHWTFGSRVEDI